MIAFLRYLREVCAGFTIMSCCLFYLYGVYLLGVWIKAHALFLD